MYWPIYTISVLFCYLHLVDGGIKASPNDIRILQDMMRGGNGKGQLAERALDSRSSSWKSVSPVYAELN